MPKAGERMSDEQRAKISASGRKPEQEAKQCNGCGEVLPASDFGRRPSGRLLPRCRPCERIDHRARQQRYRDSTPHLVEKRRQTNRRTQLRRKYGITPEDYDRLLVQQEGLCAVCLRARASDDTRPLAVDHDHATGRVRGLLCDDCNRAIGMLADDPERMERAAVYVRG